MDVTETMVRVPGDLNEREFADLGDRTLAAMWEALAAERRDPVLASVRGEDLRTVLSEPLPEVGIPLDAVVELWRERILPWCRRNGHPRFFAYVCTSADPIGILADAMASSMNQLVTAWRSSPGAAEVERLVLRWLDELVGFDGGGGGLLVSGGSSANFHALACAIGRLEAAGTRRADMTVYLPGEAHVSLRKAARILGIAPDHLRILEVDAERRLRVDDLAEALQSDRRAGRVPAFVAVSAGTANTGAIDPLEEVATLGREADVWTHVDGAYGAPAVLVPEYAWMANAFARVDSMSLDPHKWLFAPADVGCLLLRDETAARTMFGWDSEYTTVTQTDPIERYAFFDHGLEMTRRFRGLKVWSILKARGRTGLRAAIEGNIRCRRHLDVRVADHPRLESLGSNLSISCFRYLPERPDVDVDALNRSVLESIVEEGTAYLSPTTLDGRYALRVCIVNFRTTEDDVDVLLEAVLRVGARVEEAGTGA